MQALPDLIWGRLAPSEWVTYPNSGEAEHLLQRREKGRGVKKKGIMKDPEREDNHEDIDISHG